MTSALARRPPRPATLLSDAAAAARAMVRVEQAWLDALVAGGVAPPAAAPTSAGPLGSVDARGDSPSRPRPAATRSCPLVALLRDRPPGEHTARWLHRGLTSQDVLDTALMLCARDARRPGRGPTSTPRSPGCGARRGAPRHAGASPARSPSTRCPRTFGLTVGRLAHRRSSTPTTAWPRCAGPVQLGGAAGTLAALVELAGRDAGARRTPRRSPSASGWRRRRPGTPAAPPSPASATRWSARPTPGDGSPTTCSTLGRPEIGELAERPGGRVVDHAAQGQPALAVAGPPRRARRARRWAPRCTLAAADQVDERADGAWHAEWATLRRCCGARPSPRSQTRDLLDGLVVRPDVMARTPADAVEPTCWPSSARWPTSPATSPLADLGAAWPADLVDEVARPRPHRAPPAAGEPVSRHRRPASAAAPACRCSCSARRWALRPRRCGAAAAAHLAEHFEVSAGTCPGTATTAALGDEPFTMADLAADVLGVVDERRTGSRRVPLRRRLGRRCGRAAAPARRARPGPVARPCCAPARASAPRSRGSERAGAVARRRARRALVEASAERWFAPGLPRARARARARRCCTRWRTPTTGTPRCATRSPASTSATGSAAIAAPVLAVAGAYDAVTPPSRWPVARGVQRRPARGARRRGAPGPRGGAGARRAD